MLTLCWAAKGGSGTTVVAAAMALLAERPTLAVDLAGDLPTVLGLGDAPRPGVGDWLASDADGDRLRGLAVDVTPSLRAIPAGSTAAPPEPHRWDDLARALTVGPGDAIVDAGRGAPPPALARAADRRLLVTRPCYLALRAADEGSCRPTGVVLIDEPGRVFGRDDVERALDAPVVAELLLDPAVARAVDSGLLTARLPRPFRRRLVELTGIAA